MNLCWLLTGQIHCSERIGASSPILQRAASLLKDSPSAAGALSALLDILEQTGKFPAKDAPVPPAAASGTVSNASPDAAARPVSLGEWSHAFVPAGRKPRPERWIPVLGRTAAGVPRFWSGEEGWNVPTLEQLVEHHGSLEAAQVAPTTSTGEGGFDDAQLITLTEPDESDLSQFVVAGDLKQRYPDAFALRVDGDSMAPEIRHGDLVVLSPSAPAADGRAAVVQLDRQIGVTCKILRRDDQLLVRSPCRN